MKIIDVLDQNKLSLSCEIFPPKQDSQLEDIKKVVKSIAELKPSFISVTYGAGGTTSGYTVSVADEVQNVNKTTALAHLTCVASEKDEIKMILRDLKDRGIENVLALRGDVPENIPFPKTAQYHYASELIKEIREFGGFCIGGACYPESHPESPSTRKDIEMLKVKVDSGCQFLTTQMFFDNNILYNFMFRLLKFGVDVPVIAGIMPVINAKQIKRICGLSGTNLPARFKAIIDRFADNPAAMRQAGIAYATEQIIDLTANGVNNIHIYTMNKPDIAEKIMDNLSEIIK